MGTDIGGAGDGDIVQNIVLNLDTNFEEQLRTDVKAFNRFSAQISDVAKATSKSYIGMQRQLTASFSTMYKNTAQEMNSFVAASRAEMQTLEQSSDKLVRLQNRTSEAMQTRFKNFSKQWETYKNVLKKIETRPFVYQGSEKKAASETYGLAQEKSAEGMQKFTTRMRQIMAVQMGKMHAELGQSLNKSITDSLKGGEKTVQDMLTRIKMVQNRVGMMKPETKYLATNELVKQSRGELTNIERLYEQTAARITQISTARRKSEDALSLISNRRLMEKQLAYIETLRMSENQATRAYGVAGKSVDALREKIRGLETAAKEQGTALVQGLKKGLKSTGSNLNSLFGSMTGNVSEQIMAQGQGMGAAFIQANKGATDLQVRLEALKAKLTEDMAVIRQLKGTSFTDPVSLKKMETDITGNINKIKIFEQYVKSLRSEMHGLKLPDMFKAFNSRPLIDAKMNVNALENELRNFGPITMQNIEYANRMALEVGKSHAKLDVEYRKISTQILVYQKHANDLEIVAAKQKDERIAASYKQLAAQMRGIVDNMTQTASQYYRKMDISPFRQQVKIQAQAIQSEFDNIVKPVDYYKTKFKKIAEQYDILRQAAANASKSPFVSDAAVTKAQGSYRKIREEIREYQEEIKKAQQIYERLKKVQSMGMATPEVSAQLARYREVMAEYRKNQMDLGRYLNQSGKKVEDIQKQSVRSIFTSGAEMVRNFRWQVAAVIYLAQRAIWAIKNTIGTTFDEIQSFRKEALSLAATFAFGVAGDVKDTFDGLLIFSKNLLQSMQLEAAKTSLSFEDMMMLVKTVSQAGFIPKSEEDVRKIATIGAAIQALTEGMANAGVQMRQELYALIQGRQRATDQLAKMFEIMGVNIKETIANARKEGVSLIDAISKELEPFAEFNKRMADEYGVQINRLKQIWSIIKRIGMESSMLSFAKQLKMINDALLDSSTNQLTNMGRELAANNAVILDFIMEAGKAILATFGTIMTVVNQVGALLWGATSALLGMNEATSKSGADFSYLKGLVALFIVPLKAIVVVMNTISMMFKTLIVYARILVETLITLATRPWNIGTQLKKDWANIQKNGQEWIGLVSSVGAEYKDIERIMDNIGKLQEGISSNLEFNAKEMVKLPIDPKLIMEDYKKYKTELENLGISEATVTRLKTGVTSYMDGLKDQLGAVKFASNEIETAISEASEKYKISADLLRRVIKQESNFNPKAVSPKGAQGLMQIMPETGKGLGLEDPFNIQQNIMAGAKYLRQMMDRYGGDLEKTLAAYNAGPGAVDKYKGVPPYKETQDYVSKILSDAQQFSTMSENLEKLFEEGPDKIREKGEAQKDNLRQLREDLELQLNAYNQFWSDVRNGEINLSEGQKKKHMTATLGYMDWLKDIQIMFQLMDAKTQVAVDKFTKAQIQKNARAQREHDKFIQNMEDKPLTLEDKYKDWVEEQIIAINEFVITNDIAKSNVEQIWRSFDVGKSNRANQMFEDINEKWQEFRNQVESHRPKTEFQEIDLQAKKLRDQIGKNEGIYADPRVRSDAERYVSQMVEERKQLLRINQLYEDRVLKIDSSLKANDLLLSSYSPWEQRQGEMNQLTLQYNRDLIEAQKNITLIRKQWTKDGEWLEVEGIEHIKNMHDAYQENIISMQRIFEREFWKKQHPMWNEIIELSKSWGDGMTDALSEIVDGVDAVNEAFSNLYKTILKDVLRAMIKQNITQPLMSMGAPAALSNGGGGGFGAIGGLLSSLFGSGGAGVDSSVLAAVGGTINRGYAEGGDITEPIIGKGLKSGSTYAFGERTMYGEDEVVSPMDKLAKSVGGGTVIKMSMPVSIQAIDTQTGAEFLTKNNGVLENNFIRMIRNNRRIRDALRQ